MKGAVIAGTHSGCGKTTITLGVLAAMRKKGLKVQPFKAGPDFIDTGLHTFITGRTSRNLDLWMCGTEYVRDCFYRNTEDADVAVVEGVMGMYDGTFSTADLAVSLGLPVVLVVDAYGMAESAGAVVKGFLEYDRWNMDDIRRGMARHAPIVAGVIFNRVASDRHYQRLKSGVQDIPVLGYLPRDMEFTIPHRHLGLVVAEENPIDEKEMDKLADAVLEHIDIDRIVQVCKSAEVRNATSELPGFRASELKIAVAGDKAFCFYYEDNLDLLRRWGGEIVRFSPLSDAQLPDGVDALYIGGGYPELHAAQLAENKTMLDSIRDFAESGKPVYAECGGFMYLTEGIYDFDNVLSPMAGIFPFKTVMLKGRSRLGYREAELKQDSILGPEGAVVRGHEFHYSEIENGGQRSAVSNQPVDVVYSIKDGTGNYLHDEGYKINNTLGSYIHIHFGSNPDIARHFINYCKERHGTDSVSRTR